VRERRARVFAGLVALMPLAVLLSLSVGGGLGEGAILRMRLTRVLVAALVGAALSVSGVILQAVLRNPLAEPFILGISAGGGLGAVAAIVLGVAASLGFWSVPACSFLGAVGTIFLVYGLARVGGRVPTHSLLLSGVVVGAVFGSLLMFIVDVAGSREDVHGLQSVVWWLLGDLEVLHAEIVHVLAGVVALGVVAAVCFSRDLNLMVLGEEPAAHLGLHVERMKVAFFVMSSLVTAASVAACGLIGFVGLIVPHIIRLIIGPDHRVLVPAAALGGASFLMLADAVGRAALPARGVPIGVVTAFLGGPFFLFLLRRGRRRWG